MGEFTMAKVQRCQMKAAYSVLAKDPKNLKKDMLTKFDPFFIRLQNPRLSSSLRLSKPIGKKICLRRSSG
jgi:hypothetical protein